MKIDSSNPTLGSELVIIDPKVNDWETLAAGVIPGISVIILDSNRDGITQITEILQQAKHPLTTLHIISHGSPGCLYIGNTQLSLDTLERYTPQLQTWFAPSQGFFSPLTKQWGGSLLLYGCNVAAGDAGEEFIRKLHNLTQANIAASQTPTGNGVWNLNCTLGPIEPKLALNAETQATYAGVLGVKLVTADPAVPVELTVMGDRLFFRGNDDTHGKELWVSDGTEAGTHIVKDILPGSGWGSPDELTVMGDRLFFQADDGTHGDELWVSDGTEAGTHMVKDIFPGSDPGYPGQFAVMGDRLFFYADDGTHGKELWVSDGTEAGTHMFKDIRPGSEDSGPYGLTVMGDKLYFSADDGTNGDELWVSDGTEAGTHMIQTGLGWAYRNKKTVMGDRLFISITHETYGYELWVSDGTEAGTHIVKDILPGSEGSGAYVLTVMGDKLYFSADDETYGYELWVSDGTEAGTHMVKDIFPGSDSGTPVDLTVMGDRLFFQANNGTNGAELWVSDGTETGTYMLKDLYPDPDWLFASTEPKNFTVMGDQLFFAAMSGASELWVSDGTEAGTCMVHDFIDGGGVWQLTVLGNQLFFNARNLLWMYVNEAPTAVSLDSNSVDENAATGTVVGNLTSTPDSFQIHTYTLLDNAGGRFSLSGDQIVVANGTLLDYESATSHTIQVRTTDPEGLSCETSVVVAIADVNEAPTALSFDNNSVDENAATGTVVGNLTTTDPDSLDTHTYTLLNDAGGRFTVSGDQIVVADGTLLDRETTDSHSIRVQTTDPDGLSYAKNFTINVNNINEAPEISDQSFEIAEDSTDGTTVGTVTSSDVDGPTLTYSITAGNDDGIFAINEITGEITVVDSTQLDFETTDSYNLTVQVTDTEHQTSATVTVSITDANDAPEIGDQSLSVNENASNGTTVGTPTASDADEDSLTYSITAGNSDGIFTIDENTGEITVADGTQLDFETADSYNLTVQINDGEYQTSAAVTVNLTDVNETPEFTSTAPTSATQDITYTYNIVIDEPDAGDTLTITAPTLPDWLTLTDNGDGTATLTGTPANEDVGDHTIKLQVEDAGGEIHTQNAIVTVSNVNDAPTISGTPDTTVDEDSSYSFTPTAEDIDAGDTLSFSIQNKPGWATFDSATGKLSGTPANADVGTTEGIVISVNDGTETTALDAFSLEVVNTNDAPEFSSTAPTSATQGSTYTYNIVIDDPDAGDTLTITAPTLPKEPEWLTLTDNKDGTATLTGTPDNDQVGDHTIELQVEDEAEEIHSQSFTLGVKNTNDAPTLSGTPDTTVEEEATYSFVPTAEDLDGDTLSFSIQNKPDWATFDSATGKLSGTPANEDVGTTENIVISVSDGTETATLDAFSLEVVNVNDAPEITSTAPTSIAQGATYTYNMVASDTDAGDTLTITAPTLPDWLTLTDNGDGTAILSGTPDNDQVGDHTVELQVEDEAGEIQTQSFTLAVSNVNDAPTISGTPDTSIDEDSSYSFTPTAEDLDGDTLSFSIQNKPSWATFNSATGKLSGTPRNKDVGKTENIVISVTDGTKTVALDAFGLEVINTNDVPQISNQNFKIAEDAPQGITVGTVVASDADGDSLIYRITEGNDDGVFAINENTGEITVSDDSKLDFEAVPGYQLTIEVSDQETGESATVTVGITNVNEAPETIDLSHLSIAENSLENTVVGTFSTADPDNSDLHTYTLIDDADGRFKLSGNTLAVNQGDKLDYETDAGHTITVKTTDKQGLSYEQELAIAVEDGIINSESELEEYLGDRRISGLPGILVESMFDLFEVGEDDPESTPTAAIEFEKVFTVGGDKQQQVSLTSLNEYPISLTPLLDVLSQVPSYSFAPLTSLLDDLGVSIALTEPTLTISHLDTVAVYEISTQVEIPDGEENFLGFIKDLLRVDELVLKAGINSDNYHPYVAASLDLDDITLFEIDDFSLEMSGADLSMEIDTKGEASIGITPKLKLSNYDPIQSDEPPLELQGLFTFEPESITAGFMLAPEETWKNPFGLPDTEIRNIAFELGVTYAGTGFDNFNLIGDVKFGKFDIASAFAIDVNDPNKNGIVLTANQPVNLLDLWMGPVKSYVLDSIYEPIEPIQDVLEFLRKIVDINIESIDTDNDGDLDPLIKVLPEPKSIAGTTMQTGLSVNGKLTAWGAEATLKIEGNPYNPGNLFQGELLLSPIDLGFVEILGADDPNLSLNIGINLDEQYLRGDARLKMFGQTVAKADVEVTLSGFTIKDFDVNMGLVGFDIDNLSINWIDRTAKGRGKLEILGQSIGLLDFETDPNSITIHDFDVDLGLVALNVDDFFVNWRKNTARGRGELEILGQTIANADFDMTPLSLTIKDFDMDLGLVALDVDNFSVNLKNATAAGKGEVEVLGQSMGRLDFVADSDSLTIKDFYRDFGLVALDVDDFSVNWKNDTAAGKGEVEVLGYSVGRLDFVADSDSITFKNFDVDLGLVALDTDNLSVNWEKNQAAGRGELEILGQTIADADFEITPSSLTFKDLDLDLGLIALDTDKLSVNLKNQSASFNGGVEIFGQRLSSVDVTLSKDKVKIEDWSIGFGKLLKLQIDQLTVDASGLNGSGTGKIVMFGKTLSGGNLQFKNGNLTASGILTIDVLNYDIDLNVDITIGSDIQKIDIDFEFLGSKYTLISDSVDNFARKYTSKSNLASITEDIVWEAIGDIPRHLENLIKNGMKSIENVGNLVIDTVSTVASIVYERIDSLLEGDIDSFINGKPAPQVKFIGDSSDEKKDGEDNSDVLFGNGGNDWLHGRLRSDLIDGGSGNDTLLGGDNNDTLNGGDGNDLIMGQGHQDLIYGWAGNDRLQGAGDTNQYDYSDKRKQEDRDTIHGGLGNDLIWGEMGNDYLYGDAGNDTLDGGEHNDRLSGGPGKDYFKGGDDFDIVDYSYTTVDINADLSVGEVDIPGEGTETIENIEGIIGGSGNDIIRSELFGSYINGGPGNDTADFSHADIIQHIEAHLTPVSVESDGVGVAQKVSVEARRGFKYATHMHSIENIIGGSGNDQMWGNSSNNYLFGGPGNDRLFGGSGDDVLDAGFGFYYDEYLSGDDGNDVLIVGESFEGSCSGGEGTDILVLQGRESDYTFTEINWLQTEITWGYNNKIIVSEIEEFQYGQYSPLGSSKDFNPIDSNSLDFNEIDFLTKWYSSLLGSVVDGYIAAGQIFFDVNLNGVLDEDEPHAFTEIDGTFDLEVDLDQYDRNQNGVIEYTEGKIIINDGIDTSTGLTLDTPLSSLPEFTVVTPLTTIIAELVTQSDPETAQALVKAALGLLADIDLSSYDPLEAITQGDANGATVFGKMIQVQNIIVQTAKFVGAGSELPLSQVANGAIASIAQQFSGGQPVDLSNPETITAIISSTATAVSVADSSIDTQQLMSVAGTAAEVMAFGNQIIDELLASGGSLNDIATDITRLQAVSVGQIAVDLPELATGQVTPEEFLAANTVEAIKAKMAEAVVNNPTVRTPEIVLDDWVDAEGGTGEEAGEDGADSASDSVNFDSASGFPIAGSVIGSGTSESSTASDASETTSEVNVFDPTDAIAPVMNPLQPVMIVTTFADAEATPESDAIASESAEPMYLLDGHDTLTCDGEDNWVNGNQGNDIMNVGDGNDTVFGGKDSDTVFGSAGDDWMNGNKEADFFDGGEGADTLYGGEESDTLQGQSGNDWLSGNLGSDFLDGGEDADTLFGGKDGDTLRGQSGDDELFGNLGSDLMEGNEGNDLVYGGQENDTISGHQGNDTLNGDLGDDWLDGNEENDVLSGGEGNDTLDGGEGDDELLGDEGDDWLVGAAGNDTLTGGEGRDRFFLVSGFGPDTITDFTDGEDLLILDGGLTFADLTVTAVGDDTEIRTGSELLARLTGVNSDVMTEEDFTAFNI